MRVLVIILLGIGLASCDHTPEKGKTDVNWSSGMQSTAKSFQDVLPFAFDQKEFEAPKNRKKVEKKIIAFSKNTHTIPMAKARKLFGDDPYILASLSQLKDISEKAVTSYQANNFKYSRDLLKASVNACFKCHTRMPKGPDSYYWKNLEISKIKTTPVEKAQLYVSMRQYKEAKEELKKYLDRIEKSGRTDIKYENALKYYLMISLRGQDLASEALGIVDSKINKPNNTDAFNSTLKAWKKDLVYWSKNLDKAKTGLPEAKKILTRRGSNLKSQMYNDKNFINRLVASKKLHQSLTGKNSKQTKAEIYYYLGSIYDSLFVAGYWDLPELYYEMCIKYWPKSTVSEKCYENYKDNITVGYSGSRGTAIPQFEWDKLNKLEKLAVPKAN